MKKLEQELELAQSRYVSKTTNVKNPYSSKISNRTFHNEGELFYERLCGNYFIIYVYAKDTGKNMYSLPAKIAIDKEVNLNDYNLEGLAPVQLSSKPNSNVALKSVDNYAESYGYLFEFEGHPDPNQKLMIIQDRVENLCKFLNKYILNKTPDGRLNHSSPVKIGFPKSTYAVASNPNITKTTERKLGDIIMVENIRHILDQKFDYKDSQQSHLLELFFNHIYNHLLSEHFNLPIDNDSSSTAKMTSTSTINWS